MKFSDIFSKRLGIFSQNFTCLDLDLDLDLDAYYTFLSTLDYKFLFN